MRIFITSILLSGIVLQGCGPNHSKASEPNAAIFRAAQEPTSAPTSTTKPTTQDLVSKIPSAQGKALENKHFTSIVIGAKEKHTATVFLLHSQNGSAKSMIESGRDTWMKNLDHFKFVSLNAHPGSSSWFNEKTNSPAEIDELRLQQKEVIDKKSLETSTDRLVSMIDAEAAQVPGGHSKVFLLGYSKGAMLALWTGLMGDRNLGGVVAINGSVPVFDVGQVSHKGREVPIAHYHATEDAIIPIRYAQMGKANAEAGGAKRYALFENQGGHKLSNTVASKAVEWLQQRTKE
jgi:predicted esterase